MEAERDDHRGEAEREEIETHNMLVLDVEGVSPGYLLVGGREE